MGTGLKIMSLVAIVIGGLAILFSPSQNTPSDMFYAFIGGMFILALGIMSYVYVKKKEIKL